jgi:hypothetical protein
VKTTTSLRLQLRLQVYKGVVLIAMDGDKERKHQVSTSTMLLTRQLYLLWMSLSTSQVGAVSSTMLRCVGFSVAAVTKLEQILVNVLRCVGFSFNDDDQVVDCLTTIQRRSGLVNVLGYVGFSVAAVTKLEQILVNVLRCIGFTFWTLTRSSKFIVIARTGSVSSRWPAM